MNLFLLLLLLLLLTAVDRDLASTDCSTSTKGQEQEPVSRPGPEYDFSLVPEKAHPSTTPTNSVPQSASVPQSTPGTQSKPAPETSTRYATPLAGPLPSQTFAAHFSVLSTLLPSNLTYTTYSLNPSATQAGQYGQSAYANLWSSIKYSNTVLPFTTTVSPTPVPTSELVYPPSLYQPCAESASCLNGYCLPKDFVWGVASSAWQIEGAAMFEGRGPSQLDLIGALPQPATGGANDSVVSVMQYLLYKQDIARIAALGIPYYSFTISWTRIVPFGEVGSPINQPGLDHYEDVIETCLSYGPLHLQFNSTSFPDAFLYYAKQVMTRFSDRVPYWVTLNEPNINFNKYADNHNILMGHAKVYHFYKEELGGKGKVTMKFANNIAVPLAYSNASHVEAALRYQDFILGIEANPLFLGQNYPESDIAYFNGTVDFFSVDPYTTQFAYPPPNGIAACASNTSDPNWPQCVITTNVGNTGWLNGDASYAYAYLTPQYFRQHLGYIWNTFRPAGIAITEFGFNPFMEFARAIDAQRYDFERTTYYQQFLDEMLKAIYLDNINVIAALGWSVMDNNEFGSYEQQYGLQLVNRSDPMLARTYKRSFFDFVDFFHSRVQS
ncbi:beta-glucosidase [Cryomyces antarcticus]